MISSALMFLDYHCTKSSKNQTSKKGSPNFSATRSRAPLVGIDRAKPYGNFKDGKRSHFLQVLLLKLWQGKTNF